MSDAVPAGFDGCVEEDDEGGEVAEVDALDELACEGGVRSADRNVSLTADSSAARRGKSPSKVMRAARKTERYAARADRARDVGMVDMLSNNVDA